jgi:hypothetical protein
MAAFCTSSCGAVLDGCDAGLGHCVRWRDLALVALSSPHVCLRGQLAHAGTGGSLGALAARAGGSRAPIPQFLQRKLREAYPHLRAKDTALVERGLRQFFLACLRSRKQFVAMPSRAVDAMWREFILHTKAYRDWCDLSLGYILHHTPAEALSGKAKSNDGLRRAWYWACRDEAIKPGNASRLPLLFALDAKLEIANGFRYAADCSQFKTQDAQGNVTYCGGDFSSDSFSGDADGFGGMDSSDAGGDGGGGGGDGCGGGGE